MYRKIIFLLLIGALFSGCTEQSIGPNKPAAPQDKSVVEAFDCQENEKVFDEYPWFFEKNTYLAWCQECISKNGKPQRNHDAGPFCNMRTNDAGKWCTDSSQCEGFCIADNQDDHSGFCTEHVQLGDGCGWLELIAGEVAELCVS